MIRRRRNSFNLRFEPVNSALGTMVSLKMFTCLLAFNVVNNE